MEDQGKRLILAVVVALAIMLLWNFLFPPEPTEQKPAEQREQAQEKATPSPSPGKESPAADGAAATSPARGKEQVFTFDFEGVQAEFSSWGGVLRSWKLLGEQFHQPGTRAVPEDMVRLADSEHRPFSISFSDGSTHSIPANAEWRGEKKGEREIAFTWQSETMTVQKLYRLHPEDYVVELDVSVELRAGHAKQGLVVSLFSQQDPKTRQEGGWTTQPREWLAACYVDEEVNSWGAGTAASRVREERGAVGWGGFVHSYFVFAAAPLADASNLGCKAYGVSSAPGGMGVDLVFPMSTLEAGGGGRLDHKVVAYLGPKYLEKLEAVAGVVGAQVAPGFEKAVDLGFLGFIAGPLLWLLERFYALASSWGIAIILLTILVKLATLYWTHKSMKSMKEMSKLRPQLDKLREKYKDDRQKQQVETMNLFKAHGVNPLAGCLPLLLQMPIWFALYRALSVAGELYQAPFLWLTDLTAADPYFILPIFMTATMLLQSRLTPTTATGMQQKMLMYGMPLMFGVMGFFFPAGLSLYISTNTVLTLLHHLYMRRGDGGSGGTAKAGEKSEPEPVSGRKASTANVAAREQAEADEDDAGDAGDERDVESGKASAGRNGQRPRSQGRGKGPGRRGGRRKRSSRPS
jgi:YidC/Oxa1 family membrane protein insertase